MQVKTRDNPDFNQFLDTLLNIAEGSYLQQHEDKKPLLKKKKKPSKAMKAFKKIEMRKCSTCKKQGVLKINTTGTFQRGGRRERETIEIYFVDAFDPNSLRVSQMPPIPSKYLN